MRCPPLSPRSSATRVARLHHFTGRAQGPLNVGHLNKHAGARPTVASQASHSLSMVSDSGPDGCAAAFAILGRAGGCNGK
eukprot:7026962-Pyramimonas_sp.AAC.1